MVASSMEAVTTITHLQMSDIDSTMVLIKGFLDPLRWSFSIRFRFFRKLLNHEQMKWMFSLELAVHMIISCKFSMNIWTYIFAFINKIKQYLFTQSLISLDLFIQLFKYRTKLVLYHSGKKQNNAISQRKHCILSCISYKKILHEQSTHSVG